MAIKKKEILLFATPWIDLGNIMLSEISQPEKDRYKQNRDRFTNREQACLTAVRGGGRRKLGGGGGGIEHKREKKEKKLMDMDNSVAIARRRESGGVRRV